MCLWSEGARDLFSCTILKYDSVLSQNVKIRYFLLRNVKICALSWRKWHTLRCELTSHLNQPWTLVRFFSHLTFDNEHKKQIWLAHQRQNYRCMDLDRNDNSWTSSSDGSSGSGTLRWTPGPPFFSALFSFPAISYLVETKQLEGLNMGTKPEQLPRYFLLSPQLLQE